MHMAWQPLSCTSSGPQFCCKNQRSQDHCYTVLYSTNAAAQLIDQFVCLSTHLKSFCSRNLQMHCTLLIWTWVWHIWRGILVGWSFTRQNWYINSCSANSCTVLASRTCAKLIGSVKMSWDESKFVVIGKWINTHKITVPPSLQTGSPLEAGDALEPARRLGTTHQIGHYKKQVLHENHNLLQLTGTCSVITTTAGL